MIGFINKIFDFINRRSPVLIHTPYLETFGNCAEEIYFGLLKARREKKKIVFLFPYDLWKFWFPVANQELFYVESDFTLLPNDTVWHYLGGWLLTAVFWPIRKLFLVCRECLSPIRHLWPDCHAFFEDARYRQPTIGRSTLWQPQGTSHFSWEVVEAFNWRQQFEEYLPAWLNREKRRYAEQMRIQMGIPLGDWFVCLHVREKKRSNSSYRNASIQNYMKAIQSIIDSGGWVVRLGDSTMTPLPPMERVIDYPHTRFKSELMDIYLVSQCRFYFGTNSGPYHVAVLFHKQTVLVNVTDPIFSLPIQKGSLAISKHVFSRSRRRFLSLKELLDEPPPEGRFFFQLDDDYIPFENTPEEIRDVIEEVLNQRQEYRYSELQEGFNQGRRLLIRRRFSLPESPLRPVFQMYRLASYVEFSSGALGQKFLEENWAEDSMNQKLGYLSDEAALKISNVNPRRPRAVYPQASRPKWGSFMKSA